MQLILHFSESSFLFIKSIVSIDLTPYLFLCANLPNSLLMLHCQISALYPLKSCVSFFLN